MVFQPESVEGGEAGVVSRVAFPSQPVWDEISEGRIGLVFWYLRVFKSVGLPAYKATNDWFEVTSCSAI